ncbi:MFS transporter [Rhodoferax saidenbachensis]|uniref:MFS transporter n=1 Tax=Rhodoferax saidenbachensis TaxID=1484693 RepID=A0A1P8K8G8_9BURK|nr:MFS transporter [Rhodoferax saidenbachensis]APW42293.1 MFS transporter [Rhodoferax saidenbachensis]
MPIAGNRRHLIPFSALSASYFAHIGFFNPYLPLWLKDLGLGLFAISLLTSVQAATRLFAPYGWGWLSDHTGERVKLLRYGATAALLVSAGLWFDFGVWWLAAVLLLMFTHTSSMMPMSEAAMAHLVSNGGAFDAKRYGRVRLWGSLGFLVTVFVAGGWFERYGMRHFPAWTALTLLAVVASVWSLPDLKEAVHPHAAKVSVWPILQQRPVQWLFASLFFHVLSHMGMYVFFSLYLDSLGYSKSMIGVLWAVSVIVEIAWFFTQSRWLPLLSLTAWLVVCAGVMALRMGITASAASVLPLLLLAQTLHALTFAAHHSVCIALLSHHFPGQLRGRGQALYTVIGYGFPGVIGGILGGVLSTKYGLASVFWATAAISLIAFLCSFKVWRLQHPASATAG